MKTSLVTTSLKSFALLVFFSFLQIILWAQEESTTTTKTSIKVNRQTDWYSSPLVWVIGAAVFILLLVALLRGNNSSRSEKTDRVTVTKTVQRDTDSEPV